MVDIAIDPFLKASISASANRPLAIFHKREISTAGVSRLVRVRIIFLAAETATSPKDGCPQSTAAMAVKQAIDIGLPAVNKRAGREIDPGPVPVPDRALGDIGLPLGLDQFGRPLQVPGFEGQHGHAGLPGEAGQGRAGVGQGGKGGGASLPPRVPLLEYRHCQPVSDQARAFQQGGLAAPGRKVRCPGPALPGPGGQLGQSHPRAIRHPRTHPRVLLPARNVPQPQRLQFRVKAARNTRQLGQIAILGQRCISVRGGYEAGP